MAKLWLFGFLLAVPVVGLAVAEGIQAYMNSQLRIEVRRQFPDAEPERVSALTLDSVCAGSNASDLSVCAPYGRLDMMSAGAMSAGAAGIALVLMITAAGAVARRNRDALVWVFRPGLYVTASILTVLIAAHAVLVMAAIYYGESALIDRVHVGVLFAVGAGAIGGVFAVARSAFAVVKRAETLAIGKAVSREVAPQLWRLIEHAAQQLGSLMPDKVVVGVDPNFFVTEADVMTMDGRLSGRTLYCSLPLARILTVGEFTAIVGHELGHFRGADTKFSERFYPIYRGAGDALGGLQVAGGGGWGSVALLPAMAVFSYFLEAFAIAESRLGRERELVADQAGASVTDARVMATSLVKVHAYAGEWHTLQRAAVEAMQRGQMFRNASTSLVEAITHRATVETIRQVSESQISHPTDSHPPLSVRLQSLEISLESVTDDALVVAPAESAAILVPGLEALEEEISAAYQRWLGQQIDMLRRASQPEEPLSITS